MPMLSEIFSSLRLSGQMWQQFQYWREYKGEEVLIRNYSVERKQGEKQSQEHVRQMSYVVKGEIDKVMSVPPGFMLRNVTEYIYLSDYGMFGEHGEIEFQTHEDRYNRQNIREIDEKFVSFDSIEQLEKLEHAQDAIEPFREGSNQYTEQKDEETE